MLRSLRRILLACTLLALAGCIVAEPPPVVQQPPPSPPARVEVAPAPPGPGYVWVPGHWAWRGPRRGYVWVAGYYVVPAQPMAIPPRTPTQPDSPAASSAPSG